jgi:hypothetical protein
MDPVAFMLCLITVWTLIGAAFPAIRPFMGRHYFWSGYMPTTRATLASAGFVASLAVWRVVANLWPIAFWLPVPLVAVAAIGWLAFGFRTERIWKSKRNRKKDRRRKAA